MNVALVHDWLTGMRGGERCLEVFCELFPEAPVFTLLRSVGRRCDRRASVHPDFVHQRLRTRDVAIVTSMFGCHPPRDPAFGLTVPQPLP
jgi:hypothetical protein